MRPLILTTWDSPPQEHPELAALNVSWQHVPLVRTTPLDCPSLRQRLQQDPGGQLLIFSRAGLRGLQHQGLSLAEIERHWKLALVGPATAREALRLGAKKPWIGPGQGEHLIREALKKSPQGPLVLVVGDLSPIAHPNPRLERFVVYRNEQPPEAQNLPNALKCEPRAVCLASPSAVDRFIALADPLCYPPLLALGPSTAQRLHERGLRPRAVGDRRGFGTFAPMICSFLAEEGLAAGMTSKGKSG